MNKIYLIVTAISVLILVILIFTGIIPVGIFGSSKSGTWKINNDWSNCSKPCGGGTKTKQYLCKNTSGSIIDNSNCSGTKPDQVSQDCNTQSCETWQLDNNWSTCSKTCGTGTQNKLYKCKNSSGVLTPDKCSLVKPDNIEQNCNTQPCVYNWVTDAEWRECDQPCGDGFEKKGWTCKEESSGVATIDSNCLTVRPGDSQRHCNLGDCPVETFKKSYSY